MIDNPFLPSPPQAAAWAEGFIKGFAGDPPPEASETVDAESMDAFNQGVLAGEQAAANGLEFDNSCISASEDHPDTDIPILIFDGLHLAYGLAKGLAHSLAGMFVVAIELAVNLPHRAEDPAIALPRVSQDMINTLAAYGIGSMELFVGAGIDPLLEECEILVTPLFKSLDQAREAAAAMGRPQWVVGSWRTDQSNSFRIIEDSGP